uniref:Uncharacterized protein n=1 Tax=Solanum tuberosum TaxID=4113 RepID=M1D842_SOLTU
MFKNLGLSSRGEKGRKIQAFIKFEDFRQGFDSFEFLVRLSNWRVELNLEILKWVEIEIRKCAPKDLSATLEGIAVAFGDPPFDLVRRLSSVAFNIFVSWIIGRCRTASRSPLVVRRLLLFIADLLLSFRAQHTGTKGEYAIYWRFAEWVRRFAYFHFFVLLASFALFCLIVPTLSLKPTTPVT